jgi:hypothetical protein
MRAIDALIERLGLAVLPLLRWDGYPNKVGPVYCETCDVVPVGRLGGTCSVCRTLYYSAEVTR